MLAAARRATGRALKWVVEWKVELEITKMQTIPSAQNFFYHTHKNFCATKQTQKSKNSRVWRQIAMQFFFSSTANVSSCLIGKKKKHPVLGAVI